MIIKVGQVYKDKYGEHVWVCSEEVDIKNIPMVGYKHYSTRTNEVFGQQILMSKQYFIKSYKLNVYETMKLLMGLDKWNEVS